MKKKPLILAFVLFILCNSLYAVITPWEWRHDFNAQTKAIEYHNDYIYTTGTFSDSAFIFDGVNIPNQGGTDLLIMKWDTLGNLIWARTIWGSMNDVAADLKVNSNDEIIVAGHTNSTTIDLSGNLLNSNGDGDIFIAKYDLNGNYIDAYIYNIVGSQQAVDLCVDYLNNIYVASNSNIKKYSPVGLLIWQRSLIAETLDYSKIDSTVIAAGYFTNTLTLGNFSISGLGASTDIYAAKLNLDNIAVWLANVTNYQYHEYSMKSSIIEQSGKLYIGSTFFSPVNGDHFRVMEISISGNVSYTGIYVFTLMASNICTSMSGRDSLLSFCIHSYAAFGSGTYIYNMNTLQPIQGYDEYDYYEILNLRSMRELYISSYKRLGKVNEWALTGAFNQVFHKCAGIPATLTGAITGGQGPLTYSWAPATGLNNTNTNSVIFTPSSNITYTLTVTDSIGQSLQSTFNIIVDTPVIAQQITAQFPLFCKDSFWLYSNLPIPVNWQYYDPPPNNIWHDSGTSIDRTIFYAGKYLYKTTNACGVFSDTIDVLPTFIVNAIASPAAVCAGSSAVLSGSGALNYTWTGGITDNISFTPLTTQTYTVTGTDVNGCVNTSAVILPVNPLPVIANLKSTPAFICTEGDAVLRLDTVNGDVLNWSPTTFLNTTYGNNVQVNNIDTIITYTVTRTDINSCSSSANITLPVYQPSASTSDTIICSNQTPFLWNGQSLLTSGIYVSHLLNARGCDSLCTLKLTVNPSPIVHIAPGNDSILCAGSIYILTAEPGFLQYDWTLNGISISNTSSASIHEVGSHFVNLTVTDIAGCSADDFVYIAIKPRPQPVLIYKDYTLTCSHAGTVSYQWFQDNSLLNDDDSIINITTDGLYKVIVKNGFVCEGVDSISINIDMLTDDASEVSLFPNPTSGDITIQYVLTDPSDVSILLFDINGRAIHTFLKDNSQQKGFHRQLFSLDKLGIETGVYFIRIKLGLDTYVRKLLYH